MTKKIQIKLDYRQDLREVLHKQFHQLKDFRILSRGLDARGAARGKIPHYHYSVELIEHNQSFLKWQENFPKLGPLPSPPLIIGAGPAGLFCALRLAEYGIPSIIFERGERAEKRMVQIARFWRYGQLDPESNVCYGEGGAGLFSDGKLMTRIKSPYVSYVMKRLVDFGAPAETAYVTDPHLGSNKIRKLISEISSFLKEKGIQIFYQSRVESLIFEKCDKSGKSQQVVGVRLQDGREFHSSHVVLATGHSAKEIYHHLWDNQVELKSKSFSLGVRIEHPRRYIDKIQYGPYVGDERLGTARYKLTYEDKNTHRGTYSFCMCPGGYILSSGTEADGIVVNGMSNYARNSPWSNAALVVAVTTGQDFAEQDKQAGGNILEGLQLQHSVEKKAYQFSRELAGGKEIPALTLKEFLEGRIDYKQKLPISSCPSGVVKAPLDQILPPFVSSHLRKAVEKFDQTLKGIKWDQALLLAPETRTSSPVTIVRNHHTLESVSHSGLYPCGEGAGYAGGITSAAVDGIKVAMAILENGKGHQPDIAKGEHFNPYSSDDV